MAWDFAIYGFHSNRLQQVINSSHLSEAHKIHFIQLLDTSFNINDLLDLENSLIAQNPVRHQDNIHSYLGFEKLIDYRSKAICFAINQLFDYYNNHFSWDNDFPKIVMGEMSTTLLAKPEIQTLLNWLLTASAKLHTTENLLQTHQLTFPVFELKAKELIKNKHCDGKEFEFFGDAFWLFLEWQKQVSLSTFDYFYWENSY